MAKSPRGRGGTPTVSQVSPVLVDADPSAPGPSAPSGSGPIPTNFFSFKSLDRAFRVRYPTLAAKVKNLESLEDVRYEMARLYRASRRSVVLERTGLIDPNHPEYMSPQDANKYTWLLVQLKDTIIARDAAGKPDAPAGSDDRPIPATDRVLKDALDFAAMGDNPSPGPDGPVLPAALPDAPEGRGTPLAIGTDSGGPEPT